MTLTRHAYRGEAELLRLRDLIDDMPLACRHVVDLPWRLSSPAIAEGRDAVFWEDASGRVVGFAAWQHYWATLDFFIAPEVDNQPIADALFGWANARFRERDAARGYPLPYAVEYRDDDLARQRVAEAHGFLLDDDNGYIQYEHQLSNLPPAPVAPSGFTLRPLRGEQEAAAYAQLHRDAFRSDSMTTEWRARVIRAPQYQPDLDLVISAPDSSLVGFCVGWYAPERRVAQIEPLGVHPQFERLGLGRALLLEMLSRFRAHGAERAIVETNLGRSPARHAYESVGFQRSHIIYRKTKWASQPHT